MKKTLAICLSGSLRSLEYCIINFIDCILDPNKDIYKIVIFLYTPLDSNVYKTVLYHNNSVPILIKIQPDIQLNIPDIIWQGRNENVKIDDVSTAGIKGYLYQLHNIEETFYMIEEYEKKNNLYFDYILRCRTDVIFTKKIFICDYILDNYIIIPDFHHWGGINDRFALGNRNIMEIYMKMYSNIYNLPKNFNVINAEYFCKINLDNNNVKFIKVPIYFNRVRMDGLIEKELE